MNSFPIPAACENVTERKGQFLKTPLPRMATPVTKTETGVYSGEIFSSTDYYPFGMPQPGRNVNFGEDNYRYGYNGKEKDDEVTGSSGTSYNFEFRHYDPRLGRFKSVDPLTPKYPGGTPYAFAQNRPIDGKDLEGLEYIGINDPNINSATQNDNGTYALDVGGQSVTASGISTFNGQQYYNTCSNLYCTSTGISTTGESSQLITQAFVTADELSLIFPGGSGLENLANTLNSNLANFGIKTPEALSHFLGQAGQETGGFGQASVTENLNYTTAARLVDVFPSYFSLTATLGKALAGDYLNDPEKLGNYVYANRLGNGSIESGEGYLFRGRGIFQLTGKSNYTAFQTFYNANYSPALTITTNPEPVATNANVAIFSALWFFQTNIVNNLNLQNASVIDVTRRVNPYLKGLTGRTNYYNRAISVLR